ncbi:MAG: flagellar basal body P-ring formation protein FlgA [Bacteroidetes bacterium]|nr:MAG: flagellar basal body P-ring formation protein FlgA [Bacteroidota bacterium]
MNFNYKNIDLNCQTLKSQIVIKSLTFLIGLFFISSVTFSKSTFSGERLKHACIEYAQRIAGANAEINLVEKIEDQQFEEDGITALCTGNEKSLRGNCFIGVEFNRNGFLVKRLQIPARIKLFQDVPVAVKTLFRGTVIQSEDIKIEKKDITNYHSSDIISPEEIIGKKVRNNVPADGVIVRLSIENDKVINRGDKVKIVVESGAIKISASGEALQDGATGDMIFVKREGTQSKLQGKVAADGTVVISQN